MEKEKTVTYTPEQVADILQVTRITVYNYIKAKQLKATKVGGGWRITGRQLQEFLEVGTEKDYYKNLNN